MSRLSSSYETWISAALSSCVIPGSLGGRGRLHLDLDSVPCNCNIQAKPTVCRVLVDRFIPLWAQWSPVQFNRESERNSRKDEMAESALNKTKRKMKVFSEINLSLPNFSMDYLTIYTSVGAKKSTGTGDFTDLYDPSLDRLILRIRYRVTLVRR